MGSLSAHLRQPEHHAQLPFHPECPICRSERLVGTLAPAALVHTRGRAAVAAGVLALAAVAPPATLAQEPDQTREGVAAPDAPAGDGIHGTDFDPGGATIELPDEATTPPPLAGPADDAADPDGPVEQEPETDTAAPIVDAGEPAAGAGTPSNPSEGAPQQLVESPAVPEPPAPPPAPTPAAQAPESAPSPSAENAGERARTNRQQHENGKRPAGDRRTEAWGPTAPSQLSASQSVPHASAHDAARVVVAAAAATETAQSGTAAAVESSALGAARDRLGRGEREYVVRAGDSLWSIAAERLGGNPSVAAIAREVNRLWDLNHERIGTGDPDLLMVGTRVMLR